METILQNLNLLLGLAGAGFIGWLLWKAKRVGVAKAESQARRQAVDAEAAAQGPARTAADEARYQMEKLVEEARAIDPAKLAGIPPLKPETQEFVDEIEARGRTDQRKQP